MVQAYYDDWGATSPDLSLRVQLTERQLRFELHSERYGFHYQDVGTVELGGEYGSTPREYRENLKKEIRRIAARPDPTDPEQLITLGCGLYDDLFPQELKDAYASLRKEPKVRTLQITSDEPWIPWELVHPHDPSFDDDDVEDDFLCMKYAMTRWLAGQSQTLHFHIQAIAALGAGNVPGEDVLPSAREECEFVAGLAERHGVENVSPACANRKEVTSLLGREGVHLWHVAAHGHFPETDPDEASIVLEDGNWRARDILGRRSHAIQRAHPLVFFNACHVGQQDFALSRLGGWPGAWVGNQCGGFVAPQWSVDSTLAAVFSKGFYEAVESGETLGEAVRLARRAVRDDNVIDPAWLAYTVYGHPNARIRFGGTQ
jgi:hypothetical protein